MTTQTEMTELESLRAENARLREVKRAQELTTIRIDEERARLNAENAQMRFALVAFMTQANKLSGFPIAYEPYAGALVLARAALKVQP